MRVKSDPVIPNNTQAVERPGVTGGQEKWKLEIERAMLASRAPQAAVLPAAINPLAGPARADATESTRAAPVSRALDAKSFGRSKTDHEDRTPDVPAVYVAPIVDARAESQVGLVLDVPTSLSTAQAGFTQAHAALGVASASSMQIGGTPGVQAAAVPLTVARTSDSALSGPGLAGAPAPAAGAQPAAAPLSVARAAADPAPLIVARAPADAVPPGFGAAVAATPAHEPQPDSTSPAMSGTASVPAQAGSAGEIQVQATAPGSVPAVVAAFASVAAQDGVGPISALNAAPIDAVAADSRLTAAVASYAALSIEPIGTASLGAVVLPSTGARDEPMPDETAAGTRGAARPVAPEGEPYGLRNFHLTESEEGMHAWVRDTGVTTQQGATVAQALAAQFVQQGVALGSVTVNGRTFAARTAPDGDERDMDGFASALSDPANGPTETSYQKGAA